MDKIKFNIDEKFVSKELKDTLMLNSFSGSSEGMKGAIDRLFNEFSFMVHDGMFSNEYLAYLQGRKVILEQLANYQSNMILSSNDREMDKYFLLSDDMDLLDRRIALVSENLETRSR